MSDVYQVVRAPTRSGNYYFGIVCDSNACPCVVDLFKVTKIHVRSLLTEALHIPFFIHEYPNNHALYAAVKDWGIMDVEIMLTHAQHEIRHLGNLLHHGMKVKIQ